MNKVLNKVKLRKIILFIIVIFAIMISMFFVFNKESEYKELPKVKIKEQINLKQFALMLEQTKGEKDYKESNSNELPLGGYRFNEAKSGCTDINGEVIENSLSYDYANYTVILYTNKTLYCYLYYDRDDIINYLRSKDNEKHLSENLQGGMYRYQGLYTDEINNYICLGDNCCTTESCSASDSDDMYRIIGITDSGEMKVIKKTALTDSVKWWSDYKTDIKWPQSLPYQKLNGKSEGLNVPNYNDVNSYYYSLDENLKNKIVKNHSWLYGDTTNNGSYNGNTIYGIESGSSDATYYQKGDSWGSPTGKGEWGDRIEAPIGLMYISDYLYAYKISDDDAGNPRSGDSAIKSWIYLSHNQLTDGNEWTMSRYGFRSEDSLYHVWNVTRSGSVGDHNLDNGYALRPSFYLSSDIELDGEGSLESPFKIF